ncbi:GATA transcription factor 4-like [Musa acuminata AAA Group]|uniref:GATA transcription factor 4-like n=1 Tax=Musa acuminata AAA Group TaxID=214697 RepID=UPI0031CF0570
MAPEWEMAMMGIGACYSISSAAVSPLPSTSATPTSPAYLYGPVPPTADAGLCVDDLLDFSHHDLFPPVATDTLFYATTTVEPSLTTGGSTLSEETFSVFRSQQASSDLYIPHCEDAAELEWLSKFVEDSFSDVPYETGAGIITPRVEQSANGPGARSKRSSAATGAVAAEAWSSMVAPLQPPAQNSPSSSSSSSSSEFSMPKPKGNGGDNINRSNRGKKGVSGGGRSAGMEGGAARRCTHCASEKTPQWRTGPLGPKTLCNACGVRYKSGRLVAEYRPAASPTFVLTQHSNSHRKVMELRRQKELLLRRHHQENHPSSSAQPELLLGDYGAC